VGVKSLVWERATGEMRQIQPTGAEMRASAYNWLQPVKSPTLANQNSSIFSHGPI